MGIKGLNGIIMENAPLAIRKNDIKSFFGRKVAIDASMSLYQFLIAVRQTDGTQLLNDNGETTSHLMGIFYRTLRMIDNGIKPVYVFDGKPPDLKKHELDKRKDRRKETEEKLKEAQDQAEKIKQERRLVRVTPEHNKEAQVLLKLMGIPFVVAPSEAEAQCAELAKGGKVYAAASEDMDTLCYRTPFLLRHLTFSEAKKEPVQEVDTEKVLESLNLTIEQFIDLGLLLGCDYIESIRGIGPVTALKLIKEHGSLEAIIKYIEEGNTKWNVPEDWNYQGARDLFLHPDVIPSKEIDLKWSPPDEEGLMKYLCDEKLFNEDRVKSGITRLKKGLKSGTQVRLDGFFKVVPKTKEELAKANARAKAQYKKSKVGKKRR
ncbi:flap endonuclease 1 [Monosporozyma unispora]|nr:Elongation of fatty acids protein 2 [Kazachstania unispora]